MSRSRGSDSVEYARVTIGSGERKLIDYVRSQSDRINTVTRNDIYYPRYFHTPSKDKNIHYAFLMHTTNKIVKTAHHILFLEQRFSKLISLTRLGLFTPLFVKLLLFYWFFI